MMPATGFRAALLCVQRVVVLQGMLMVACTAWGQGGDGVPPRLARTHHVPISPPDLSGRTKPAPLVPNGAYFGPKSFIPAAVAFSPNFVAIGPAPINPGYSGRVAALAVAPSDNNVIYVAAAGGGVWKTTDAGSTWTALTDSLPDSAMGSLAIDPTNPNVIYAGSGEANFSYDSRYGAGLYKSTDGGSTWTVYTGPANAFHGLCISKIAVDPVTPANVYLTTTYGHNSTGSAYGVFKSTDAGVTWTKVLQVSGAYAFTDLAIDPSNPLTLYAAAGNPTGATSNGIYKTVNGGANWTLLTGFPNGSQSGNDVGRISLAIAPSNSQVLYADYSSAGVVGEFGSLGGFWSSLNGGSTWTQSPMSTDGTGNTGVPNFLGTQGWYDNVIIVNPTNAQEVFAAGQVNYGATGPGQYVAIIASYDGGSTWDDYTYGTNYSGPHTDHHALIFTSDGSELLDGNDGGIWRCENPNTDQAMGTIQWTNLNTNLNITQFTGVALHPTDDAIAYGGSQDNGTEEYTGSLDWTQVRGGDGGFTRVDQTTPTTVYHEYYGISLERSDDGGHSWTNIAGTTGINPDDPVVDDGDDPSAFYVPYVLDAANQSRILYGTDHLYESLNRGDLFTAIGTPGSAGFNPNDDLISALGGYGSTIYVYAGGTIYVTKSDGASWTTAASPGNGNGVSDIYVNPGNTLDVTVVRGVFDGGHVYHSLNGGVTWTDISGNLPNEPFLAFKADTSTGILFAGGDDGVYFSTNSGGSWVRANLPEVQVVDLAISPGAGIIAAGTHGRGAFISPLPVPATGSPAINSALTAGGAINQPFNYQITATNYPQSFGAGGLPAGLLLNAATGMIAGTPTVSGSFPVLLSATNPTGTGTATLTLTIAASQPVVTSPLTAAIITGQPFSYQITASNYPLSFGAGGLPAGLSVNTTTGVIAGAPTVSGTFPVTLSATNTAGTGTATLTLTITVMRPVVNSALTAAGTIGQPFSYQITALNYPTSFGASGLPAGLSLDTATGVIAGTPAVAGSFPLALAAINSAGVGIATLTLTVAAVPPVVNSALTAAGTVGQPFTYQITALYDPTSFAASGLPAGLTVNTATGLIAGTPAVAGFYTVTILASGTGGTGTATLALTIAAVAPVVNSATAVRATVHSSFQYLITAGYMPTSFGATGLPPGLSVDPATGEISGAPSELGEFLIILSASNAAGTGTATLRLEVGLPIVTLEVVTPSVRNGSGGIGEFKLRLSVALPTKLTIRYRIRGHAINGVDYVRLSGEKTFAPGQLNKPIRIRPKGDLGGAKEKIVKLRLESGPGYTAGTNHLVEVKILAAE